MIKKEIKIFLTAVMFYTRLPVPANLCNSDKFLNKATRYLPVIGWLSGGFCALIFWGSHFVLPHSISIVLSMAAGILITGAFHEDGFADVCDGFGGGYTKEQRQEIMKDSRIGTYGTIGLIFILSLKFLLISQFSSGEIIVLLIVAHSYSRLMPVFIIYTGTYSGDNLKSKIKPVGKRITSFDFILSSIFALAPAFLLTQPVCLLILLIPLLFTFFMKYYFDKRISGYTGDCLGATQQVSEIIIYLSALLILQNITT